MRDKKRDEAYRKSIRHLATTIQVWNKTSRFEYPLLSWPEPTYKTRTRSNARELRTTATCLYVL